MLSLQRWLAGIEEVQTFTSIQSDSGKTLLFLIHFSFVQFKSQQSKDIVQMFSNLDHQGVFSSHPAFPKLLIITFRITFPWPLLFYSKLMICSFFFRNLTLETFLHLYIFINTFFRMSIKPYWREPSAVPHYEGDFWFYHVCGDIGSIESSLKTQYLHLHICKLSVSHAESFIQSRERLI